jgi:hypothetical protein
MRTWVSCDVYPIGRTWSGKEVITVSLKVVDQVIEGSPTYEGFYAIKHGPYVLARDPQLDANLDIDQVKISNVQEIKVEAANQSSKEGMQIDYDLEERAIIEVAVARIAT